MLKENKEIDEMNFAIRDYLDLQIKDRKVKQPKKNKCGKKKTKPPKR
jgi:hypothetical protein